MGTMSLYHRLSYRGVALTTHPNLTLRLKKEYSYTSTPPRGLHGLFYGELYLYLLPYLQTGTHTHTALQQDPGKKLVSAEF